MAVSWELRRNPRSPTEGALLVSPPPNRCFHQSSRTTFYLSSLPTLPVKSLWLRKVKALAQCTVSEWQSRASSPGQLPTFCSADTEQNLPYPLPGVGGLPDKPRWGLYTQPHLETSAVSLKIYLGQGP